MILGSYSADDTAYATQNTSDFDLHGTYFVGETIVLSTCGNTGDTDTFLRLVDEDSGVEVARSDDDCNDGTGGSKIVYTVPNVSVRLVLKAGCYWNASCSGNVIYRRMHDTNGYMDSYNGGAG